MQEDSTLPCAQDADCLQAWADAAGIAEYDEEMRRYYHERTGGKIDRVWSADMSALLGKESRPHMRAFLEGQGFTFR